MAAPRPVWQARAHEGTARVLWGRWNSEPAVKVRDPAAASSRLTRWNSWTDGQSPDGKRTQASSTHRWCVCEPSPRSREGPAGATMTFSPAEQAAMARALELAATSGVALGPNPRVGCVLLDDGG